MIEERTSLVNKLREALHHNFPAALEAFDDWTMPRAWAFQLRSTTPAELARKGFCRLTKTLSKFAWNNCQRRLTKCV